MLLTLGSVAAEHGGTDDFEADGLAQRWTGVGDIRASREIEEGNAFVRVRADRGGILASRAGIPVPEYRKTGAIRFRCRVPEGFAVEDLVVEIQIYSESRRGARFWRKLDLTDEPVGQWLTSEIPLAFFRHSGGFHLDWGEVERFGFYFRNAGVLDLDDIAWVAANDRHPAPWLTPQVLAPLAFGEATDVVRTIEAGRFVVLTDAPVEAEGARLELARLEAAVAGIFPGVSRPRERRVPLLIFAAEGDYRNFWPSFGEAFDSISPPPRSDGYAALGVAAAWHDPAQGPVRPVLLHEACHALLAPEFGLANRSEWLHEGLASYFQLPWTGQDLVDLNRTRIRTGNLEPLAKLCDGSPISLEKYAQAALLVKWLVEDEERLESLRRAIERMSREGTTDLGKFVEDDFGISLEELETRWHRWAEGLL